MVVIVLENVTASVRGELTRWMLELKSGVFIGTISAMVRDKLWDKICEESKNGGCLLVHNDNNEQGFSIRSHGNCGREIINMEGLWLVRIP